MSQRRPRHGAFLHIIDLGSHRESNERYVLGTVDKDPFGGDGRWIKLAVAGQRVNWHSHLSLIATEGDGDIITLQPNDYVT